MFFVFWLDWIHYRNHLDFQVTVGIEPSSRHILLLLQKLGIVSFPVGLEVVVFPSRFLLLVDNKLSSMGAMKPSLIQLMFYSISCLTFLKSQKGNFWLFLFCRNNSLWFGKEIPNDFIENDRRHRDNPYALLFSIKTSSRLTLMVCQLSQVTWLHSHKNPFQYLQ